MKEKLISILGLPTTATEDDVVAAVKALVAKQASQSEADKFEARIRKKITESGGALNRDQAIISIEAQDAHDAARAKAAQKETKVTKK